MVAGEPSPLKVIVRAVTWVVAVTVVLSEARRASETSRLQELVAVFVHVKSMLCATPSASKIWIVWVLVAPTVAVAGRFAALTICEVGVALPFSPVMLTV